MNKVINFHDVEDKRWFESTITILNSKYNMVDIKEIESYYYEGKQLQDTCHVTVDDGSTTFYEIILPILNKYKIPATIFVSPYICTNGKNFWFQEIRGYNTDNIKKIVSEFVKIDIKKINKYSVMSILKTLEIDLIWKIIDTYKERFGEEDKKPQNMTIDQLLEIDENSLITIGAHSVNHPILANENDKRSKKEIIDCIKNLENIVGHEITSFAYPNGMPGIDFGQREMNILESINCKIAFSTESKNFTKSNNPFSIPRYGLSRGSESFIKTKLFLGEYWEKIKNLRSKGEYKERMELNLSGIYK